MGQFTKKKISKNVVAIVDVGSYKIRVGICEYKNKNIKLLGFAEKRQSTNDIVNNSIENLEGVCENIELAIKKAEKKASIKVEDIIINPIFSENFFYSKNISHHREDYLRKIDINEFEHIITKTEEIGIMAATKRIESNYLYKKEDLEIIVSNISEIKIDKKIVQNPIGETGENLSLAILNIFISKSNYELIKYIGKYLKKNIIKVLPEEFCLAKIWEKDKDVVIVNIGNSSSYITLKDNSGNITGSIKIGVGIESLINKIQEKSDLTRIEIIKQIDKKDFCPEDKVDFLSIYSFLIIGALKEILGNNICPNNFFIIGGGGNNDFFKDYFENMDLNLSGIKQVGKIRFILPDIAKIGLIENVEDVLCKSNLNIISMMIVYSKILENKNDIIEKSLEKAVKTIMKD